MNVKYVGTALDYSGYGEAARHDIAALLAAGVHVTAEIPNYTLEIADFGRLGEVVRSVAGIPLDYDIIINHLTPNMLQRYHEPGKYHIARMFWETDKIPLEFAESLKNFCDEIWTGSEYNKQAILAAGVTKPIHVIPQAIETDVRKEQLRPYKTQADGSFRFYSIFEWTMRKNPLALLEAYWSEFQSGENVSLTIKTYLDNFLAEKRKEIDFDIASLKARLKLENPAPLYLSRNLMDRQQVYRFHASFDCFVSAHRGEGWGIPQMEALLLDQPVISTNCGGIHEYLAHDRDAKLIPFELTPLSGNNRNHQWYTYDQKWADVDIPQLRAAMRAVYEDQKAAEKMGITGGQLVREKFAPAIVGKLMLDRLEGTGVIIKP